MKYGSYLCFEDLKDLEEAKSLLLSQFGGGFELTKDEMGWYKVVLTLELPKDDRIAHALAYIALREAEGQFVAAPKLKMLLEGKT